MTQTSRPQSGKYTDGYHDAGGYTSEQWARIFSILLTLNEQTEGVVKHLSDMVVTNPLDTVIRVASGAALVRGRLFVNENQDDPADDSDVDFTVDPPATGSRIDRVVLVQNSTDYDYDGTPDYGAAVLQIPDDTSDYEYGTSFVVASGIPPHTCRLALLLGDESSGGAMRALTQDASLIAGDIWMLELARYTIDSAGAITLTDMRDYAPKFTTENLEDDAVTSDKIADSAVTSYKIASSAVTSYKIADNAVTSDKIADSAVTSYKIASSAVTSYKIADNAVTSDKIADSAVTSYKIASSAVTSYKIADNAVTSDKIASNAVTPAKIPNRTREVFIPVDSGDAGIIGDQRGIHLPNGVETQVYGHGIIPRDFVADANLIPVICNPDALSGAGSYAIFDYFCALASDGEIYDTHTTSSTGCHAPETLLGTIIFLNALALPDATVGDTIGVTFVRHGMSDTSGATFYLRGFILRYTADS